MLGFLQYTFLTLLTAPLSGAAVLHPSVSEFFLRSTQHSLLQPRFWHINPSLQLWFCPQKVHHLLSHPCFSVVNTSSRKFSEYCLQPKEQGMQHVNQWKSSQCNGSKAWAMSLGSIHFMNAGEEDTVIIYRAYSKDHLRFFFGNSWDSWQAIAKWAVIKNLAENPNGILLLSQFRTLFFTWLIWTQIPFVFDIRYCFLL